MIREAADLLCKTYASLQRDELQLRIRTKDITMTEDASYNRTRECHAEEVSWDLTHVMNLKAYSKLKKEEKPELIKADCQLILTLDKHRAQSMKGILTKSPIALSVMLSVSGLLPCSRVLGKKKEYFHLIKA